MTEPMNDEPTDTVVMLRALANDPALTIGQAWNALEHAANEIEALRTLENPIRSAAEPVAWMDNDSGEIAPAMGFYHAAPWIPLYAAPPPRPDPPEVDEALRRDAERFRWWRDKFRAHSPHMDGTMAFSPPMLHLRGTTLDDSIDAALTAALKPAAGSGEAAP